MADVVNCWGLLRVIADGDKVILTIGDEPDPEVSVTMTPRQAVRIANVLMQQSETARWNKAIKAQAKALDDHQ